MSRADLNAIFNADRALRQAEARLLEDDPTDLLLDAISEAKALDDEEEAQSRLIRLADLCAQVPGVAMIEGLIDILDSDDPQVRVQAGEALLDVTFDYYGDVARAIEARLDGPHRGPCMVELPFILVEVGEGGTSKLLKGFLRHPDPEVIAAGIEAAVEAQETSLAPELEKLTGDQRDVTIADFEVETEATVGALASEALELFAKMDAP
jgi:hypothetical protein